MREQPHAKHALDSLYSLLRQCHGRIQFEALLAIVRSQSDVTSLANRLEVDISQVSRCLQSLERADLVQSEQRGHRRVYRAGARVLATPSDGGGVLLRLASTEESAVCLELGGGDIRTIDRMLGVPGDGSGYAVKPRSGPA